MKNIGLTRCISAKAENLFADCVKLTPENARIILPDVECYKMHCKYDFKAYMHRNWDK